MGSMKVHQLARGLCWDQHEFEVPSLTLGCKRLRPLAPKQIPTTPSPPTNFDLKSFIRPDSGPRKLLLVPHSDDTTPSTKKDINNPLPAASPHQVETHPGGTRWNPTQEQIGILEMLYRGGMRTPNAQQIEQITGQLSKYGKIEGKNVFYWFQNHKARERQKQKRALISHAAPPRTLPTTTLQQLHTDHDHDDDDDDQHSPYKKKCRTWAFEHTITTPMPPSNLYSRDHQQHHTTTTLELFPLHPQGR